MKALIISQNDHIGHLSHVLAWYKLYQEIGYNSIIYIHPKLRTNVPNGFEVISTDQKLSEQYDVALIHAPNAKNIQLIFNLRKLGCKDIAYVFHEPIDSFKPFKDAGFSWKYIMKLRLANLYSAAMTYLPNHIILSSKEAIKHYSNSSLYRRNAYTYIPLIFDDEYSDLYKAKRRLYFSYIGTIAADHSFQEYLDFVSYAIKENKCKNVKFLIATKSHFDVPKEILASDRVVIQKGRPMTNEEINTYYASTFCVWNAYARTTQSGVLAKSFMFGTPALVLKRNCNEFVHDGIEIRAIEDNANKQEIASAIEEVIRNFDHYSKNCRKQFMESFYYRKYNKQIEVLIK